MRVPAKMSAKAAKASPETVLKARAGKRVNGKVAKRILAADALLAEGLNTLVENVSKEVNK